MVFHFVVPSFSLRQSHIRDFAASVRSATGASDPVVIAGPLELGIEFKRFLFNWRGDLPFENMLGSPNGIRPLPGDVIVVSLEKARKFEERMAEREPAAGYYRSLLCDNALCAYEFKGGETTAAR